MNAGADEVTVDRAAVVAVHLVNLLVARQRRLTPADEAEVFERRRLWLQPNLARTLMTGTLTLSGVDAEHLLAALDERADQLSAPDDPLRGTVGQRRADAFVSLATDHQTGTATSPRRPKAHVFIDADLAASTNGEAGALTTSGLQVGPNTLGEILCVGSHDVTLIGPGGVTALPTTGTSIPTRIRAFVRQRDGGCTADGCTSTYRLEPHHIIPRSQRGTPRRIGFGVNRITSGHHPDNLTLLCWFHHHVVIHQRRYTIDPQSPPGRRRFLPPNKSPPDSG